LFFISFYYPQPFYCPTAALASLVCICLPTSILFKSLFSRRVRKNMKKYLYRFVARSLNVWRGSTSVLCRNFNVNVHMSQQVWNVGVVQPQMVYRSFQEPVNIVKPFYNELISATWSNRITVHDLPSNTQSNDGMDMDNHFVDFLMFCQLKVILDTSTCCSCTNQKLIMFFRFFHEKYRQSGRDHQASI